MRRLSLALALSLIVGEPNIAGAGASPIEIKLDVVDAAKEVASWVQAGFGRWDASQKEAVKQALPSVVADLTEIAAVKRQLASSPWVNRHDGQDERNDFKVANLHRLAERLEAAVV